MVLNEYGMKIQTSNLSKHLNPHDVSNYQSAQPLSATIQQPLVLPHISKWKQNLETKK